MRPLLLAAGLVPALPAALPDLLPPGHQDVRHELVLEWGPEFTPYAFVASPVRGFHGHVPIARGEPFRFSSKYGTRIFAAPAGAALPAPQERIDDVAWPNVEVPLREVRSIAAGNPLARVRTTLRVVEVTGDSLLLERVREQRFDAHGNELGDLDWLPLLLLGLCGAAWLWWLDRRRRPAAGAAS